MSESDEARSDSLSEQSDSFSEQEHTVVDLFLYGTMGLAMNVAQFLADSNAVAKKQIKSANTIGKFVTPVLKRKLKRVLAEQLDSITGLLAGTSEPASSMPSVRAQVQKPSKATKVAMEQQNSIAIPGDATGGNTRTKGAAASSLGIDGYDDLPSASIVPLLEGLTAKQLEAVHRYELENRARRTILHRASQLADRRASKTVSLKTGSSRTGSSKPNSSEIVSSKTGSSKTGSSKSTRT